MYLQYFFKRQAVPAAVLLGTLLYCLFISALNPLVFAETPQTKSVEKKNTPIKITSETMKSFKNKNMVTFTTNVVVRKENMTIFSDRLDLFTDKENKNLVRVVATGNVRFKKDEMSGTSEKAIYEELEKKITLLGNPVIKKADSVIKGSKIVYFQEDESIVAESDSASPQVEVILFPEQLKQMDEGSKKSIGK